MNDTARMQTAESRPGVPLQTWTNALAAAVGGLLFGYDTSVIAGAILFVREHFHLTSVSTEIAVSIVLAGALVGAAIAGYAGDRFGRKRVQIVNAIVFAVFSIVTGLAGSLTVFLVGRFLVGVAVGVTSMITPLYISEIAPPKLRGAMIQLNQTMIAVGIAAAYLVAWIFSSTQNWRAMFLSATIPALILLVALFFLPESPRWLAIRGQMEKARLVLRGVYGANDAEVAMEQIVSVIEADDVRFRDLLLPRFRKPLIAGAGLAVFQQITGVNTIIYYTPIIMQMAGFHSASDAILSTLLLGVINIFFALGAMPLLDRLGRRPLLLASIGGMFACLILLGYSLGTPHPLPWLVFGSFLAYLAAFSIGLGPVFWILISEIYPTRVRGQAMSLASVVIWAFDWIVALTFLSMLDHFGARGSFWIYAAACVAAFLFAHRYVPETKGKTLEEIEAAWCVPLETAGD